MSNTTKNASFLLLIAAHQTFQDSEKNVVHALRPHDLFSGKPEENRTKLIEVFGDEKELEAFLSNWKATLSTPEKVVEDLGDDFIDNLEATRLWLEAEVAADGSTVCTDQTVLDTVTAWNSAVLNYFTGEIIAFCKEGKIELDEDGFPPYAEGELAWVDSLLATVTPADPSAVAEAIKEAAENAGTVPTAPAPEQQVEQPVAETATENLPATEAQLNGDVNIEQIAASIRQRMNDLKADEDSLSIIEQEMAKIRGRNHTARHNILSDLEAFASLVQQAPTAAAAVEAVNQ